MGLACNLLPGVLFCIQVVSGCLGIGSFPILRLRLDENGDGLPDLLGSYVEISGWVTSPPGTFGVGRVFSVEDGTSGIFVFADALEEGPERGSIVHVSGTLAGCEIGIPPVQPLFPAYSEVFIEADHVEITPCQWEDIAFPVSLEELTCAGPEILGRLVSLEDVTILGQPPQGFDSFLGIEVSGEGVALFIDHDTELDGMTIQSPVERISGLLIRMSPPEGPPVNCIVPRWSDDFEGGLTPVAEAGWGPIKRFFQ